LPLRHDSEIYKSPIQLTVHSHHPSYSKLLQSISIPFQTFVSYALNMSFFIPESAIHSTISSTSTTCCSTSESILSDVEVRADDPFTTCFLSKINPLLFKMTIDSNSDEEDNLYIFSPLTPIKLDTLVPFPATKLMAHAINDPVNKSDTTSLKLLKP
jgi:hypothetical protein